MGWLYKTVLRPALFAQDSETVHHRALRALHAASMLPLTRKVVGAVCGSPELPVHLWGLRFPNPVGLAAGMDKFCEAVPIWEKLGFGFAELGGITALEQPGNDKPRLFRALTDQALVNRMGFNNPGCDKAARALQAWHSLKLWPRSPVGVNLGKSKVTPLDKAAEDYGRSIAALWPFADFFVINVSSPNTPNLRQLQDKAALDDICAEAQRFNAEQAAKLSRAPKPILVKVAPDLSFTALDEILDLAGPRALAGIVATNTTITRPAPSNPSLARVYAETGGLSGRPLRQRSLEVIRHLHLQTKGTLPIIGVGGIFTGQDAWEAITAGASLVQVYTGFIYEGPGLARTINRFLRKQLRREGLNRLEEAVGIRAEKR